MTKLGRHNPYSAWLISVQPDICKCLLFPLFVAFCDSVYCFSYVSYLPLFRRVLSPFTAFPFTHLPNPLTLPLLGFSGKSQFFSNADRFCVVWCISSFFFFFFMLQIWSTGPTSQSPLFPPPSFIPW